MILICKVVSLSALHSSVVSFLYQDITSVVLAVGFLYLF